MNASFDSDMSCWSIKIYWTNYRLKQKSRQEIRYLEDGIPDCTTDLSAGYQCTKNRSRANQLRTQYGWLTWLDLVDEWSSWLWTVRRGEYTFPTEKKIWYAIEWANQRLAQTNIQVSLRWTLTWCSKSQGQPTNQMKNTEERQVSAVNCIIQSTVSHADEFQRSMSEKITNETENNSWQIIEANPEGKSQLKFSKPSTAMHRSALDEPDTLGFVLDSLSSRSLCHSRWFLRREPRIEKHRYHNEARHWTGRQIQRRYLYRRWKEQLLFVHVRFLYFPETRLHSISNQIKPRILKRGWFSWV